MNKDELKDAIREESWELLARQRAVALIGVIRLIDQLDEPEKVVVPDFVGEFITENPQYNLKGLYSVIENQRTHSKLFSWLNIGDDGRGNADLLAQAYLHGYTVEEKKYQVIIGGYVLRKFNNTNNFQMVTKGSPKLDNLEGCKINLTEQEIKNIDPRLWSLAEEVK